MLNHEDTTGSPAIIHLFQVGLSPFGYGRDRIMKDSEIVKSLVTWPNWHWWTVELLVHPTAWVNDSRDFCKHQILRFYPSCILIRRCRESTIVFRKPDRKYRIDMTTPLSPWTSSAPEGSSSCIALVNKEGNVFIFRALEQR